MKVYKVNVGELTIVFDDLEHALDEVRCQIENGNDVSVMSDDMTEEEFAELETIVEE